MPELPEVEVARRNLARWSAGRSVVELMLPDPEVVRRGLSTAPRDADPEGPARIGGAVGACGPLHRHGKRLGWRLGEVGLLVHFGMTGRWVRRLGGPLPDAARLGLVLDDGATLWFCDARRFGCVAVVDLGLEGLGEGLGPDALDHPWTGPELRAALAGRTPIKPALLEQQRIAGLGNIHAAEALFRAQIDPWLPCGQLDPAAADRLVVAFRAQLEEALVEFDAEEVTYLSDGARDNPFLVYGREGLPCVVCAAPIQRAPQAGRSTWWCPSCQRRDGGADLR
jgi:formamidopyrimidine-DNA glycosylase